MSEAENHANDLVKAFEAGELIVYPTEAVMGIGCDPDNEDAVQALLAIKQRPISKGVILIAANYSQLLPYVDDNAIRQDRRSEIFSSWPGPVTWLLPKSKQAPVWITGEHDKIAVRVTSHPLVIEACLTLGKPLVSTSANPSGLEPARTVEQARDYFAEQVYYLEGEVEGLSSPSTIKDSDTLQVIRG